MEQQGRPEELFELLEQLGKGSYGDVYKVRAADRGWRWSGARLLKYRVQVVVFGV
jgi:serine/threonine protein kinase